MNPQPRVSLLALSLLSFLVVPGLTRDAYALPISNDVAIDWQQKAYAQFLPTVVNGNFVVNNAADLAAVEITIAITHSELLGGFSLLLDVVNPITSTPGDYTEILAGGSPLKLTFAAGYDNNGFAIPGATDPAADTDLGGDPSTEKTLTRTLQLSALQNSLQTFTPDVNDPDLGGTWSGTATSTVLASLLASGPLGFSINGTFTGNVNVPADLDCQANASVCKPFPGSASITVSGGQAFPAPNPPNPPTTVPEPGSFSLLLAGAASIAGSKLRRRS